MKTLFSRLRGRRAPVAEDVTDSVLASSMFPADGAAPMVDWATRAAELKAHPLPPAETAERMLQLWHADEPLGSLGDDAPARLARWLQGADVPADRELLKQDEIGDHLLVLLEGRVVVERRHPNGSATKLMEARPGDLLGEMALFDGGPRFSACRTLTPCCVAVLDSAALDGLLAEDSPLAAALLVSITRRIALRLRQTGARLSALLAPQ